MNRRELRKSLGSRSSRRRGTKGKGSKARPLTPRPARLLKALIKKESAS